jgi:Protein of unknown function (DUF3237)
LNGADEAHCERLCRIALVLRPLVPAIGPAGDVLHVPFAIVGGTVDGDGIAGTVIVGVDFTTVFADEKVLHDGRFVIADPNGDVVVRYEGTSQAHEGAYDDLIDGTLPGALPCRLSVQSESTHPAWRSRNRTPLVGTGTFDAAAGRFAFTVLFMPFP